ADRPIEAVDPQGAVSAALPPQQCIGCVLHLAASMPEPGLVAHAFGNRFLVGDPLARGAAEPGRAAAVAELMCRAGLDATVSKDMHAEDWSKRWVNMRTDPMPANNGASMDHSLKEDDVRAYMTRAMIEAGEVSRRVGIELPVSPEERHKLAAQLGPFKTSM